MLKEFQGEFEESSIKWFDYVDKINKTTIILNKIK